MKCIKHMQTNEILRVTDEVAAELVRGYFNYVPKSEWKAQVRDLSKGSASDEGN